MLNPAVILTQNKLANEFLLEKCSKGLWNVHCADTYHENVHHLFQVSWKNKYDKSKWSVKPVFGEVEPRVLHEFTYVTVNVSPLGLLRHDASYVTKRVIVERISNEIVHVTSMRHSCNYNFTE